MVIERRVAARNALEPVVKIENDFIQRHLVGEHDARGREIFELFLHAALFLAQRQHSANGFFRGDDHRGQNRLFDSLNRGGRRKFRGVVDFHYFAIGGGDAVLHAGRGGDQVDIEFALQPLLRDFHVQQAEKSAAEAEAQRDGIFRLVEKRGVVQLQLAERVAQHFVIAGVHRKKAGEDHGLDGFEAGKRLGGAAGLDDRIAHARVGHTLDIGDDEAHIAGREFLEDDGLGREHAEIFDFVDFVARRKANFHVGSDAAFHHAHQHHRSAIGIEPGIENQRAQRRVGRAFRRRNAFHDGFEDIFHAQAAFGADQQRVVRRNREDVFDLLFRVIGLRGGQVDFIDHGNDGEIVARGEERIRDGLRFHSLARVDYQQRALARGKRAGDFVGKIDVAGRVDQIEAVLVAVVGAVMQADAFGLDGDAALALEVHGIEQLSGHFALGDGAGQLQQAVGQRGFTVVDVRDDAEIPDEKRIHGFSCECATVPSAPLTWSWVARFRG